MKTLRILLIAIFTIAALAYMNAIVPMQKTAAHIDVPSYSETNGPAHVSISLADDACGGFFKAPDPTTGKNEYTTTATLTNTSSTTLHNFVAHWKSFWCKDNSELTPGDPSKGINPGSCYQREQDSDSGSVITLGPGQSVTISAPVRTGDNGFSNCGLFQNDLWYEYNNGFRVTSSWNGHDFGYSGVGYCKLWDGHTLISNNPWSPKWECGVNPTPTIATPTPTIPVTPTPSASCYFKPASLQLGQDETGHTTLYFSARHLPENNKHATICLSVDGATPQYRADTEIDYGRYPIPVDVTAPHTYQATVYLKNNGEDDHSCSGTTIAACSAQTYLSGTPTPTQTPTPTPTTTQGCTSNCNNVTVNVHQEQQQQQEVLAATVAPAPTTSSLPSTGASDLAVIPTLISLIAAGWKLRKLV